MFWPWTQKIVLSDLWCTVSFLSCAKLKSYLRGIGTVSLPTSLTAAHYFNLAFKSNFADILMQALNSQSRETLEQRPPSWRWQHCSPYASVHFHERKKMRRLEKSSLTLGSPTPLQLQLRICMRDIGGIVSRANKFRDNILESCARIFTVTLSLMS